MTNEELIADATKVAAFMLDPDETTGMNKCGALIGQLITALRAAEAREQKLREANGILEAALQKVGDDYPSSSCQEWCQQQVAAARRALGGEP